MILPLFCTHSMSRIYCNLHLTIYHHMKLWSVHKPTLHFCNTFKNVMVTSSQLKQIARRSSLPRHATCAGLLKFWTSCLHTHTRAHTTRNGQKNLPVIHLVSQWGSRHSFAHLPYHIQMRCFHYDLNFSLCGTYHKPLTTNPDRVSSRKEAGSVANAQWTT